MKVNLGIELINIFTGQPIPWSNDPEDGNVTLGRVVLEALGTPLAGGDVRAMVSRYDQIKAIKAAGAGEIELTAEAVAEIKALVVRRYESPALAGPVLEALEGAHTAPVPAVQ